jgi:catechol 2,3-dioxygenase-like lactoylglutathione lyase family enzyme
VLTANRIIETALYVNDTAVSADFYVSAVGAQVLSQSERLAALSIGGASVLLLFKKGGSLQPTVIPGGTIPGNDANGQIHIAFAIESTEVEAWEARLRELQIEIESTVHWDRGGRSMYFRDPDGHNIELATPGIWDIY